jgi:hypothetical protein
LKSDQLKLVYAVEDIVITGRGLYPLYVELSRQTVAQVIQQGERYAAVSESPTVIVLIERVPHPAK